MTTTSSSISVNPASLATLPLRSFCILLLLFSPAFRFAHARKRVSACTASAMPSLRPAPLSQTLRKFTTLARPRSDDRATHLQTLEVAALKFRGTEASTIGVSPNRPENGPENLSRARRSLLLYVAHEQRREHRELPVLGARYRRAGAPSTRGRRPLDACAAARRDGHSPRG